MADPNAYNQIDIARYLQKQMTTQEMHAFEKAMLEDPFLADAMEGYQLADSDTSRKHLLYLEKAMKGSEEKAKVIAMPPRRNVWWRATAAACFILLAGIIIYQLINDKKYIVTPQEVAASKAVEVQTATDSIQPGGTALASKSAEVPKDLLVQKNTSPVVEQQRLNATPYTYKSDQLQDTTLIVMADNLHNTKDQPIAVSKEAFKSDVASSNIAAAAPVRMQEEVAKKATVSANESRELKSMTSNQFVGKVVDPSGEPLPFASVKVMNSDLGTVTDAKGAFTLNAPDSVLSINVSSAGYAVANAQLKSNKATNHITMLEDKSNLSEVVVSTLNKRKASLKNTPATAEPQGGWTTFNRYVNIQVDSFKYNNNIANGDIELEFDVDKEGKPREIKVVQQTNRQAAEKAVDIIQNGPRWKVPKKRDKVKLKIAF